MKEWVNISDVLFFQEGPGVRNTQYTAEGVKLLNVANLVDGRVDLSTSDRYISEEEAYGKYKHFLCDDGDFVVASSGIKVEYLDKKMGFIDKEMLPLCMNTSTIRFKVLDEEKLNIRYFMYYVKSQHYKNQVAFHITGSAQSNYGPSHLKKMVMPLIGIEEQQIIVTVLDKVSAIIASRQHELQKLDELINARFVEMFECNQYEQNALEKMCSTIVDCPHTTPKYEGELLHPAIRTSEIKKGYIDWTTMRYVSDAEYDERTSRLIPLPGDIVYGREGTLGNAVILPPGYKFCLGQRVMLMRPDYSVCTSEYLLYAMLSESFYRQVMKQNKASTVAHVNIKDIKKFVIPLPPMEEQVKFSIEIKQINQAKTDAQIALDKAQLLFDSLMQQFYN